MGSSPTTAPMLMSACPTSHAVSAAATSRANGSAERCATRMPPYARTPNSTTTSSVPTRPSSSPMIARMKSVCALGR